MINSVRNTVLAILNKNNYGYISPQDFNLFAKQAQIDIFEDYFYQYNYQLNKENKRMSGTGYADITKGYEEVINIFSEQKFLLHNYNNRFFTPSLATTNDDYYLLNKVLVYSRMLASGTNTVVQVQDLVDNTTDFVAAGVNVGDIVGNVTTNQIAFVQSLNGTNTLVLVDNDGNPADIFLNVGEEYIIYDDEVVTEAEKVTHSKITLLNSSLLTAPSTLYPAYTQQEPTLSLFPPSINTIGAVQCQYIRYPFDPQWTYTTLTGGEPVFNPSNPSYQNFELPLDDEYTLVLKILQFAGMSIRELQAVQFGQGLEGAEDNQEK
tara:strand:+ start:13714 stop:14676 length:963 start_codon:yes stop_codon:yes gene_type:complete